MSCNAVADWPDWQGQTAIVVGTGPSAARMPLSSIESLARCVVVKASYKLAPWADALYGTDMGWWVANKGIPAFKGLKFCPAPRVSQVYQDIRLVRLKPVAKILTAECGVIGCGLVTGGGHSGFQAVNLAIQFGVKRVILVGFDMTLDGGAHWHDDYRGVAKPDAGRVKSWREAMDACAPQFEQLGVEVLNASPVSALRAYRKVDGHELIDLLSVSAPAYRDHHHRSLRSCVAG